MSHMLLGTALGELINKWIFCFYIIFIWGFLINFIVFESLITLQKPFFSMKFQSFQLRLTHTKIKKISYNMFYLKFVNLSISVVTLTKKYPPHRKDINYPQVKTNHRQGQTLFLELFSTNCLNFKEIQECRERMELKYVIH